MGGKDNDGILVTDVRQDIAEPDSFFRVEACRGLVDNDYLRIADNGLCYTQPSFHTTG